MANRKNSWKKMSTNEEIGIYLLLDLKSSISTNKMHSTECRVT